MAEKKTTKKTKTTKVQFLATGRRKKAIARVFLIPEGSGQIIINKKDIEAAQYKSYYDKNKGVTPIMQHLNNKKNE